MSNPKTVLCVDDDVASLKLRQHLLEVEGFTVIIASSAPEGLALFSDLAIDAVVLDYQMPGMNGGELAKAMKLLKPEIPIMIVSALSGLPEDAPSCIDAFISKCAPGSALTEKIAILVP